MRTPAITYAKKSSNLSDEHLKLEGGVFTKGNIKNIYNKYCMTEVLYNIIFKRNNELKSLYSLFILMHAFYVLLS